MGQAHCFCRQRPCVCHNGWGTHFETLDELLGEIDAEIARQARDVGYTGDIVERPQPGRMRDALLDDEIAELWGEGLNTEEIAAELMAPKWLVKRTVKALRRKEWRERECKKR